MYNLTIELMRHLSDRLNLGDSKPNYRMLVWRKTKKGEYEPFPFEIPSLIGISLDRRYNMAADELKVTVLDINGTMSPDYSPDKEYRHVRALPRSGFRNVLVPFNRVEFYLGYGQELRKVFTGQIVSVTIAEENQSVEVACKNMFRILQKPIDPKDKKSLLYEKKPASEILLDLMTRAGCDPDGIQIDSVTLQEKDFTVDRAEFQIGMYYSDAVQQILDIMSHRIFADRDGTVQVKLLELYSQTDFVVWEIDDYVNMTSGEYTLDPSFVRNRVIIQSNSGWQAFEDSYLLDYCNGELISSGLEVPWAQNQEQRWAVADQYFLDMRKKLRRITVAAKGNPSLDIGDLVKMSGLISTMTEKYMVTGLQSNYSGGGYLDQIDLEYVGKGSGHICQAAEGEYIDVDGSVSGGGMVPVMVSKRQQIVNYALSFSGTWYQWGGDCYHNPKDYGFDCSHFIWVVLEKFGLMEQYAVSKDMYKLFSAVTEANIQPGDLVFYSDEKTPSTIRHVGMYTGRGYVISAHGNRHITTIGEARKRKKKVSNAPMGWDGGHRFCTGLPGI